MINLFVKLYFIQINFHELFQISFWLNIQINKYKIRIGQRVNNIKSDHIKDRPGSQKKLPYNKVRHIIDQKQGIEDPDNK